MEKEIDAFETQVRQLREMKRKWDAKQTEKMLRIINLATYCLWAFIVLSVVKIVLLIAGLLIAK